MNKRKIIRDALAGLLVTGVTLSAGQAFAGKKGFEKCAGVVKSGMNDCGNARHDCSGKATKNGMVDEWLYVPNGTCKKIVGAKMFVKNKK